MIQAIETVRRADPDVAAALEGEYARQTGTLEMIASENFASPAVLAVQGSVLTNKYAEGYPGRRYYGGCEQVDSAESLAIRRAKELFGAEHANVQPHSGSQANTAVYFAALEAGDTILSMGLDHGGHLSHGLRVNFSGRFFHVVHYGVKKETETIDYDAVARLAREHRPRLIIAGGSAYPRTIDFERFRVIAEDVEALLMVDMAHFAGLVAGGVHPSPVPFADYVTSTTHKTLRGPRSGLILCREAFAKAVDKAIFPGTQGGPMMHTIAAKAVALREAMTKSFRDYAAQIVANARVLAEELQRHGLRIVSGGTDTHLLLVDLAPVNVTGKAAEEALERAGITVNKNMIPFDARKPTITSGVRIGTPALTTRGMREDDMRRIAAWIARVVKNGEDEDLLRDVRAEIAEFAAQFPYHVPVEHP
ncbi:MAG TPA: serine hydroxymethyltransferase [Sumerlaeia bacterium]|nr:serine hydroxymethyltransferase [Sumerlaeia bacterium]